MYNCFSYAIHNITGDPEQETAYAQDILPLVRECKPQHANIVMKVDGAGPYHAAVISKRDEMGMPLTVTQRARVGAEIEEVPISALKPSQNDREIHYYFAENLRK